MTFDARTHASIHLKWSELACRDTARTPYPLDWREDRGVALGIAFEHVRAAVGGPLVILSAYRTPAYNRQIGGAPDSQHVHGRALDLAIPKDMMWGEFVRAVRRAVSNPDSGIRGLGVYPARGFVHIDVRPGDRLVTWMG